MTPKRSSSRSPGSRPTSSTMRTYSASVRPTRAARSAPGSFMLPPFEFLDHGLQDEQAVGPTKQLLRRPLGMRHHAGHIAPVSYTHLRAHETRHDLVCRLL